MSAKASLPSIIGRSAKCVKVGLPVARIDIRVLDRVPAVQHFPAAHIDTHMGYPRCIVSAYKKDQVARPRVCGGYRGGNVVKPLGSQSARVADAAFRQRPGYEPGTVKGSVGIAAAPDISCSVVPQKGGRYSVENGSQIIQREPVGWIWVKYQRCSFGGWEAL